MTIGNHNIFESTINLNFKSILIGLFRMIKSKIGVYFTHTDSENDFISS